MRRIILATLVLVCLSVAGAAAADAVLDGPLGLSQLLGPDDEITVKGDQIREELEKHAGFVPHRVKLPKQPVSTRRCMAPVVAREPVQLIENAVSSRGIVSIYRTTAGGFIRQTCTRDGYFRSLRATSPLRMPDGVRRQVLTETLRQDGELLYGRHLDYSTETVARAWQSRTTRRQMLENGRIR